MEKELLRGSEGEVGYIAARYPKIFIAITRRRTALLTQCVLHSIASASTGTSEITDVKGPPL